MAKEHVHPRSWRVVLAATTVAVLIGAVLAPGATSGSRSFIQRVQIGDTPYSVYDIADILSLIPQVQIRTAMRLVRSCSASGHYGYYSRATGEVGAVAWFPSNPLDCLGGVSGGGPGGPGACYHAYWANDTGRSFVAFYGNTAQMCARMSTQVPGGAWVRTSRAVRLPSGWLSSGAGVLVKCQRFTTNGYYGLGVLNSGRLPGSRRPYWFAPWQLSTGNAPLARVPSC
jgi:hypothetical protein